MKTNAEITIRACRPTDLEQLQAISYQTFDDTFRHMNARETMEAYLAEAFDARRLEAELANPHSQFFFLFSGGELAGYLKVNEPPAQTDLQDPASLEIERIYIRQRFQGQGLGARLLEFALDTARAMGKQYVWLGVWEKNAPAFAFYTRKGFERIGEHTFRMGDELQTDWIMKKAL